MTDSIRGVPVASKWLKLGLVVGTVQFVFLLVLLYLLTVEISLALGFAVVGSILGGVAFMLFVTYVY